MVRLGVIGYGYWGPNLVRNFMELEDASVTVLCDLAEERRRAAQRRYPSLRTTGDARELIAAKDVDAVIVATPVAMHYELALAALKAGKHVLVEKPITQNPAQAKELIEAAAARKLRLMVDHTFVYTGAVRKIRELIETGELGDVFYYDSTRINLGLFQRDVDVIWDLAIHDLSILDYIVKHRAQAVSATGAAHVQGQIENVAYLTVYLEGGALAHVNVNWLSPVKIRRTLIGGSKKMVVYDDLEPSEKIRIYDKGVTLTKDPTQIYEMLVGYRSGDMWAPQIETHEALYAEARHFVDCVANGKRPASDGEAGLRVIEIAEAATRSMRQRGQPVQVGEARR